MDAAQKRIVHHGIVFVAHQPLAGVMPDFPKQVQIGLKRSQPLAHLLQETVGDLISHVITDSVDVKFPDPVLADAAEIVDHLIVIGVQLGHPVREGEGIEPGVPGISSFFQIVPVLNHEPVGVSGFFLLFQHVQPGSEAAAAVVEHRVNHNADAVLMRLFHQSGKILIGSELGIDAGIVLRIIFVGGIRLHDGVQVNARNAQLLQVRKLLLNPLQISSETLLIGDRPRVPGHDVRRVFLRRPVAEAVRENLIPYRFVHPVRRSVHIGRVHPRHDEALEHTPFHLHLLRSQKAVLKIVPDFVLRMQLKIIFAPLILRAQGRGPPELVAEPFLENDLLPFSRPFLSPAHDARFIRVPVMQENPLHIIACFQVYDQLVLV